MIELKLVKQLALSPFTQLMGHLPHFAFPHHLIISLFSFLPAALYTCVHWFIYVHVYMIE